MGAPVLIGAGIGAATSLAMGKNPLQGALLGGIGGGAFGGAGGIGSGFTEGGLFASAIPSAGTTAATTAGTAFGANQAPLSALSSATTAGTTGAMSSGTAGTTASPYAFGGNELVTSSTKPLTATMGSPMSQGVVDTRYMATEGMSPYTSNVNQGADLGAFDMANMTKVPAPDLSKNVAGKSEMFTGGGAEVEKPLYEQAYESVINYAKKNPLEVGGLALVASGGIKPRTPQQPVTGSGGSITKGTPPQQAGQILKVRRPTRFA
jgi:hypothetical protein